METLTADAVHLPGQKISHRIDAIDFLRGTVMIIMALDHTRELFHISAYTGDPVNLQTTTPILFFTRWITYFCAPVFVFLSGTSIFLQTLRKPKKALSAFLLKRGLWLIAVELLIMTFAISFDITYSLIILQVIWAIGISMVLLSGLIWLPFRMILLIGLLIVLGHNALDFWQQKQTGPLPAWYALLHVPGIFPHGKEHALGNFYPFLPWTGTMLSGYCFGKIYQQVPEIKRRNGIIFFLGLGLVLFFVLLRWGNFYGDPLPWSVQKNTLFTFLSFLNTQKYPPSLLYLCMTLGPALIFLGLTQKLQSPISKFITVYGRVPFFYYILHFYILHIFSVFSFLSRGHTFKEGLKGIPKFPFKFIIPGEGYSLTTVYLIWIVVILSLYPLCKWFSNYKQTHRQWWLSYL